MSIVTLRNLVFGLPPFHKKPWFRNYVESLSGKHWRLRPPAKSRYSGHLRLANGTFCRSLHCSETPTPVSFTTCRSQASVPQSPLKLIPLAERLTVPILLLSASTKKRLSPAIPWISHFGAIQAACRFWQYRCNYTQFGLRGSCNTSPVHGIRWSTYQTPWEYCEPQNQLDVKCWGLPLSGKWGWHL